MKRSLLLVLPLLAACSGPLLTAPAGEWVTLPRDAVTGAGDPTRSAAISAAAVFGSQHPAAGQPAVAARAIAQMEFLAATMPTNNQISNAPPTLMSELNTARREWRRVLDIAPDAPPQAVVDALYAAARALDAGQRAAAAAALPPSIFRRGGAATLAQLASLPPMVSTAAAAASAQQALATMVPSRGL